MPFATPPPSPRTGYSGEFACRHPGCPAIATVMVVVGDNPHPPTSYGRVLRERCKGAVAQPRYLPLIRAAPWANR